LTAATGAWAVAFVMFWATSRATAWLTTTSDVGAVPDAWVLVKVTVLGAGAWLDVKVLLWGLWLVSTTVVVVVGAAAVLELSDGADTVLEASAGAGASAVLRVKLAVAMPADVSLELGRSVVVLAAVMGAVMGTAMTTGVAGLAGEGLSSEVGEGDEGAVGVNTVTGLLIVTADTGTPDAASCRLIIGSCSWEGLSKKYSSAGPSARNSSTSHRCMAAALGTCRLRKRPLAAHSNRPWLLAGTLTPVVQAGLVEPSCAGCSPNLMSRPSMVQFPTCTATTAACAEYPKSTLHHAPLLCSDASTMASGPIPPADALSIVLQLLRLPSTATFPAGEDAWISLPNSALAAAG
jgi:hypothetical protein